MELDTISCPICNMAIESSNHIFSFSMVIDIYRNIATWWDLNLSELLFSYEDWWPWLKNLCISSKIKQILKGVFYIMWWFVWNYRKKVVFGSHIHSTSFMFDDVVARSFTWCRFRCKANFSWVD